MEIKAKAATGEYVNLRAEKEAVLNAMKSIEIKESKLNVEKVYVSASQSLVSVSSRSLGRCYIQYKR